MALTVETRIERTKAIGRDEVMRNAIIYTILFWGINFLNDPNRVAEYEVLLKEFTEWLVGASYYSSIGYLLFWHSYYAIPVPEEVEETFAAILVGF